MSAINEQKWVKAASVWTGGKPWFWVLFQDGRKVATVIWQRGPLMWGVYDETLRDGQCVAFFKTPAAGRKHAENWLANKAVSMV